jgi:hypothetical protein
MNTTTMVNHEEAHAAVPAHHETRGGMKAIDEILARRAQAGKLVAGVAAASSSDMFKGPVSLSTRWLMSRDRMLMMTQTDGMPLAKRWDGNKGPGHSSRGHRH